MFCRSAISLTLSANHRQLPPDVVHIVCNGELSLHAYLYYSIMLQTLHVGMRLVQYLNSIFYYYVVINPSVYILDVCLSVVEQAIQVLGMDTFYTS